MTKIEQLEHEIDALSPPQLSEFRRWFLEFDAVAWDAQLANDVQSGALDHLASAAIAEHRAGHSRPV